MVGVSNKLTLEDSQTEKRKEMESQGQIDDDISTVKRHSSQLYNQKDKEEFILNYQNQHQDTSPVQYDKSEHS